MEWNYCWNPWDLRTKISFRLAYRACIELDTQKQVMALIKHVQINRKGIIETFMHRQEACVSIICTFAQEEMKKKSWSIKVKVCFYSLVPSYYYYHLDVGVCLLGQTNKRTTFGCSGSTQPMVLLDGHQVCFCSSFLSTEVISMLLLDYERTTSSKQALMQRKQKMSLLHNLFLFTLFPT